MENLLAFFISDGWAQAAPATGASRQGGGIEFIIMLAVLFGLMYFMILRPQAKRTKQHKALVAALAKGDEVVTNGGILGRITKVNDQFVTLELAQGVEIKVQRHAIQTVMPKGTIKSAS